MARPTKQGLDYFPLDVQFLSDIKIRKIMRAQGANSVAVIIALLCNIYKDNGYYILRDEDMGFLISDEVGVNEAYVEAVIDKAIQVGFFDYELYEKYGILTSNGIQKRFFEATERRKEILFNEDFRINVSENGINVNINPINANISTQSKVKESKVKESKVDRYATAEKKIMENKILLEQAAMSVQLNSVDEVLPFVEKFIAQKRATVEIWKSDSDLFSHFLSWIRKVKQAENSTKNQNNGKFRKAVRR